MLELINENLILSLQFLYNSPSHFLSTSLPQFSLHPSPHFCPNIPLNFMFLILGISDPSECQFQPVMNPRFMTPELWFMTQFVCRIRAR